MSKHLLIAAFEDAVHERDLGEDDEVIEMYDNAREALEEAIAGKDSLLALIAYVLDREKHHYVADNQLKFLELWSEGEFETLRENWDDIPDEVFIGADTQFVPKGD